MVFGMLRIQNKSFWQISEHLSDFGWLPPPHTHIHKMAKKRARIYIDFLLKKIFCYLFFILFSVSCWWESKIELKYLISSRICTQFQIHAVCGSDLLEKSMIFLRNFIDFLLKKNFLPQKVNEIFWKFHWLFNQENFSC
jgi:hypothetical protein